MSDRHDRRDWLRRSGGLLLAGALPASAQEKLKLPPGTCIVGQPVAAEAGARVLAAGGNAVDAAVAAALVAGVVAVQHCGPGGYGGHMVIAIPRTGKVTAIDFNSAAPAAAKADMFPLDEKGQVKGRANTYGWLAAGVPGTLAGLELAADRYGRLPLAGLIGPALQHARDGFKVPPSLSTAIRAVRPQLQKDPVAAALLLQNGTPLKAGTLYRNAELAGLLEKFAARESFRSFYEGDIAKQIAAAFKKNGGLVTAADLANYQAREVAPLALTWRDSTIYTAPLTAGGATVLEALNILKALGWEKRPPGDPATRHAQLEALRLAWDDRLRHHADPARVEVPLARLLSPGYARLLAAKVEMAVRDRKPAATEGDRGKAGGTIHLSVADDRGMMVALTLTHGGLFGAQVAVPGLGLFLGHGMSRFDPRPKHPNAPGPGKRPLHNMCPTIVVRHDRPVLALGGTGGRRIPNAVFDVLTQYVGRGAEMEDALAAPRLHTEGDLALTLEASWPEADAAYLKQLGYTIRTGPSANIHAVTVDPKTGACRAASR